MQRHRDINDAPQNLFDHLVGATEEGIWNGEAERFRGFEIDHELDFGRLLERQIGRLFAFEYASSVDASLLKGVIVVGTVAHQAASCGKCAILVNCRQPVLERKSRDLIVNLHIIEERTRANNESVRVFSDES
jgi:hypothetical protein